MKKVLIACLGLMLSTLAHAAPGEFIGIRGGEDHSVSGSVAPVDGVAGLSTELRNTTLASFTASTAAITMGGAASPVVMCAVYGSATKTVKVTRVALSGSQTTAGQAAFKLTKHSTINLGIVNSTMTTVAMDSNNAAGTGYAVAYTTNPTQGTLTGMVRAGQVLFAAPATASIASYQDLFGYPDQPVVLRGVAQHLDVSLIAGPLVGGAFNCNFTWTEE